MAIGRLTAVVLAALLAPFAAPGASSGQDSLVAQAKKEGRVVWYTALALDVSEQVARRFEEAYGIRVELTRSGSERVVARVLQEAQTGVNNVDVIEVSEAGDFALLKQRGLLKPYHPSGYERFPRAFLLDDEGYFHAWRGTLGLPVYNTRLVPAGSVPKSWKDFTSPVWKDRLLKVHYGSGAGTNVMLALANLYGWDYYRELRKNNPAIVQAASQGVNMVASGERAILLEGNHYNAMRIKDKGNPVDVIFPTEGVVFILSPTGISKNAPHPNAAMLFVEHMFSRSIQQLLIDRTSLYVPHPDVKYPADMPPLGSLKILSVPVEELARRAAEVKQTFSAIFGL